MEWNHFLLKVRIDAEHNKKNFDFTTVLVKKERKSQGARNKQCTENEGNKHVNL